MRNRLGGGALGGSAGRMIVLRSLIHMYSALDGKVCALQMRLCVEM